MKSCGEKQHASPEGKLNAWIVSLESCSMRFSLILAVIAVIALAVKVASHAPSVDSIQTVAEKPAVVTVEEGKDQLVVEDRRVDVDPPSRPAEAEQAEPAVTAEATVADTSTTAKVESVCACNVCGKECDCADPMICKNGDCKRDYAIVFTTAWCGPCKQMRPFLAKLQAEGYRIYYWDTSVFPDAAKKFGINTVPTSIFFNNGMKQTHFVGLTGERTFRSLLKPRPKYDLTGNQ